MNKTKNILVSLAGALSDTMNAITSDFKMGFGSFIDKPISPFMSQEQMYQVPKFHDLASDRYNYLL